jgi:hypothetical protein
VKKGFLVSGKSWSHGGPQKRKSYLRELWRGIIETSKKMKNLRKITTVYFYNFTKGDFFLSLRMPATHLIILEIKDFWGYL